MIGLEHVLFAVEESPRPHVGRTVRVERLVAHRRDAALLEEVLEGVKAPARTVRDAVGVDVLEVQHEEREHQLLELDALERAAALDEVFGRIDVKARLGHRVAGLGPHGGKRPEALDAGMDEMGEVDDSAGLEDAEGVDDRIAGHGRVS